MDLGVIVGGISLIVTLQIAIIVQQFRSNGILSELKGQFKMHREGCDTRFKGIEERLDKGGL